MLENELETAATAPDLHKRLVGLVQRQGLAINQLPAQERASLAEALGSLAGAPLKTKAGFLGLEYGGQVDNLTTAFELRVGEMISREGDSILGLSEKGVRQVLGVAQTEKAADYIAVTSSAKIRIVEVKGSFGTTGADVGKAVKQLSNTYRAVVECVPGAKIGAVELAIPKGATLDVNYRVNQGYLQRVVDGRAEVVRVRWRDAAGVEHLGPPIRVKEIPGR
jgi:hypothetical protein